MMHAFKEWAVVVDALGSGTQSVILRKGGIHETAGTFSASHKRFFLFPTYEHQKKEELKSAEWGRLDRVEKEKAAAVSGDIIPISWFAECEHAVMLDRLEQALLLDEFHILSEGAVMKRFRYGKKEGLWLLIVRLFKLPQVYALAHKPSYDGCRSWVPLGEPISTEGARPVLAEHVFRELKGLILDRLAGA